MFKELLMTTDFIGNVQTFDDWWAANKALLSKFDHTIKVTLECYKHAEPPGAPSRGPKLVESYSHPDVARPPTDESSRLAAALKRGLLHQGNPIESADQRKLLLGWVGTGVWSFPGYPDTSNSNALKAVHRAQDLIDESYMDALEEESWAIYVQATSRREDMNNVNLKEPPTSGPYSNDGA